MDSPRIALCLSGHVRTFERTFPGLKRHLLEPHDPDVFIHTWSVVGHQNTWWRPRPSDDTRISPERLQSLYAPTKLLVEDNAAVLQRWHSRERRRLAAPIYLADSQAEPQYIYSQLYSIHMANQLKADHEAARRFTYDVVVRLRFDFDLESAVPEEELASVTRDRDTIRVGHPLKTRHGHPGGGGGCKLCAVMPHPGPHANDVCDIVAFGSSPAMDAYAGLYDCCLDLYGRAARDNEATYALRRGWKPSRATTRRGYVYVTVHDRDYVACFYPERLLREHLVGYRLVNSALDGRLLREEAEDSWLVKIHVPMQLPLWAPRALVPALRKLRASLRWPLGSG